MKNFLFIIEDTINHADEQRGFADFGLRSKLNSVVVDSQVLKDNIKSVLNGLTDAFVTVDNEKFLVDEIEVNLQVGSQGEVSILSTVSGIVNYSSGIKVTIKRKQ